MVNGPRDRTGTNTKGRDVTAAEGWARLGPMSTPAFMAALDAAGVDHRLRAAVDRFINDPRSLPCDGNYQQVHTTWSQRVKP
jgi:hypothetical protein